MQLPEIKELHAEYLARVNERLNPERDASTRPEGVFYLLQLLRKARPSSIGEFGSGFSTLALRQWAQDKDTKITTLDHHPQWIEFVKELLADKGLPDEGVMPLENFKNLSLMMSFKPFDAVFIDHGPTMAARWQDVPWILSLVKPGGLVVFDDWWPEPSRAFRSTKRIIRILTRMGLTWEVIEQSRPDTGDKAICVVRL